MVDVKSQTSSFPCNKMTLYFLTFSPIRFKHSVFELIIIVFCKNYRSNKTRRPTV